VTGSASACTTLIFDHHRAQRRVPSASRHNFLHLSLWSGNLCLYNPCRASASCIALHLQARRHRRARAVITQPTIATVQMNRSTACKAALLLLAAAAAVQVAAQGAAADGPTYYIAADVVDWNYAPAGVNLCNGELFTGSVQTKQHPALQSLSRPSHEPKFVCLRPALCTFHVCSSRRPQALDAAGHGQRVQKSAVPAVHRCHVQGWSSVLSVGVRRLSASPGLNPAGKMPTCH
jgi:hypothetical protein